MTQSKVPSTEQEWYDYALHYCSRFETSRQKLHAYLVRKLRSFSLDPETLDQSLKTIDQVLDRLEQKKIVDHERFAGILTREYQRRGKGTQYIIQKLNERGLHDEVSKLEKNPDAELSRAIEVAAKQLNRSTFQKIEDPYRLKNKLLQRLVAAGFDYSVSKKAIDEALKTL